MVTGVRAIAQTGLQESAAVAGSAKNTLTNLHQGALNTFNQIQQTFTTTISKTSETAVTGFAQTTQGVDTAFNQVNQNLDSNFQKATNDLETGLRGALQGAKQPNLESDIDKYAQQAADQEQPRWKTVLKVLLVIAVIVVAIIVAPAVIGAVGAVAGALGASAAAAGTIGAVVGGAIVGAVAGAVIQVGNNAIDGKNLLDGVGKAALVGAIGGALGGAGGALGNALGQAGKLGAGVIQSGLKFGIDVAFDIAGSIASDLAVGNPITLEGILKGAAIGAAVQISTANLGRLGKFGRNVEGMQTRTFQAGERFGTSLGGKVKGAFGGVDAPKVGSNDAGVGGVKTPETGLPKGDRPEVDAPGSTKSDMDMPSVKQPESEVKPETNIPSGRSTHLDEPEIEPGVVAKTPTTDGHEIKVLKDGRVVRCSDCQEMDISPEAAKAPNSQDKAAKVKEEYEQGEQLLNAVKSRINSQPDKFELTYTKEEMDSIIKKGKELGLSDKVIEDLIYTGSRKAKAINAEQLIGQMEHWVNVISKRGYPEKFDDIEQFQDFSKDLIKGVKDADIPADDIRIQGSSLRKTDAGDVDIAVFVDEPTFDGLLIKRYDGKITIKETNEKVSLNGKSHEELVQLAQDIAANPKKYNAQGGTFQNALLNGIISSKSDISRPLKEARKAISTKYPHLNVEAISVLIKGGRFDVKPDLPIKEN